MKKIMAFMMLVLLGSIYSVTQAADVLPEAGKTYLIKSDNVNTSKVDEDYYLYNDNGTLKLSATKSNSANYQWTCEKNGENFRFKNQAGKYLAFTNAAGDRTNIPLDDTNCDFKIDSSKKINEGCFPLYAVNAKVYMLVKNGGTAFNQSGNDTYNKKNTSYSSDYIFEEVDENAKTLTVTTDPAGVSSQFSWNGETYTGSCSFTLSEAEEVKVPTLTVAEDPASPYEFIGFYEGDEELGKTVEISSLTANRNITAKFNFNIYSSTYGEKWIRITWNSNETYAMGLPISESYTDVAPKTITSDLGTESQLWCFVGTAEGFKIYNKAAGENLALTTENTTYQNGTATFMKTAATATIWHLVNNNGWNISPLTSNDWGLNSYAGAGNALKLYKNGDKGNIWNFQKSSENALAFQIKINGEPKALNTNIGQLEIQLGSITNLINVNLSQKEEQKFYLANDVKLNFGLGGTQYRGYKFRGFQINDDETLQENIEDLTFNASLKKITAIYDVDTEDPSQYLFYTPGYQNHPYRIPAITTTKDNKVLAISDFRWCGADIGFGHVDIVGRISEDNGNSWSDQFYIASGSGLSGTNDCGYGDAAVVTDSETGKILIMCCTGNVFYGNGTRENPLRSARLYSEDNGKTWSIPEDITKQMYALLPNSTGQFIGAGKICQSRVTKVGEYYRLYAALCTRPGGNYVIYSDDFGQTWAVLGGNETSCAPSGDEPKCEELPDGSVVLSSRKYSGRYFNIYKYTNKETAEGKWLGVVSSNDTEGGLKVEWNSTNGEIQLVKVIKKDDDSFHYMMIQSLPYGKINEGDAERSNVTIFYKIFDQYTMNSATELATGWTLGMQFKNPKGAYSTMCVQPDKKLGFFYEEGPNDFCMVYRPISIEELTGDAYTMYDPTIHGVIDEEGKALETAKADAKAVLDELAEKHADVPAYGEYPSKVYNELKTAYDNVTVETITELGNAVIKLQNSCNWPVFTINNMHPTYGVGNSIYDNNSGSLYFKKTDLQDQQMMWKFANMTSKTMTNGDYVVTNVSTGNKFWGADKLNVSSTNPAEDGQFIIKTNGTGDPVHAQQNGSVIVRWNDYKPNTGSAWSFTYVGDSYNLREGVAKITFINTLTEAKSYIIGTTTGTYADTENGDFSKALQAAVTAQENGIDNLNNEELTALTTSLQEAISQLTLNLPKAGKYYRIKSKTTGKFIASNGVAGEKQNLVENGDDINTVFFLAADNTLTGSTALNLYSSQLNATQGCSYIFAASSFKGYYTIKPEIQAGYLYDYSANTGNLDNWADGNDEKCAWELIEVTDATMQPCLNCHIKAEGYATIAAPVALTIPAGVEAYTVTAEETNAVLKKITDVIPSGTGALLKNVGSTEDYKFTFAVEGRTENENALVGVYVDTQVAADINAYSLKSDEQGIGFYQLGTEERNVSAHQAYLSLPESAKNIQAIMIECLSTGINGITANGTSEEYYDLQGRRVMKPTKGIYVTQSGKKVLIK